MCGVSLRAFSCSAFRVGRLRQGLRGEGFTVDWVQDGPSAERALETTDYALVLLDLGLPRKDGLAVLGGWRWRGLSGVLSLL